MFLSASSKESVRFTKELGFSRLRGLKLLTVPRSKNLLNPMEKLSKGQESDTHTPQPLAFTAPSSYRGDINEGSDPPKKYVLSFLLD